MRANKRAKMPPVSTFQHSASSIRCGALHWGCQGCVCVYAWARLWIASLGATSTCCGPVLCAVIAFCTIACATVRTGIADDTNSVYERGVWAIKSCWYVMIDVLMTFSTNRASVPRSSSPGRYMLTRSNPAPFTASSAYPHVVRATMCHATHSPGP